MQVRPLAFTPQGIRHIDLIVLLLHSYKVTQKPKDIYHPMVPIQKHLCYPVLFNAFKASTVVASTKKSVMVGNSLKFYIIAILIFLFGNKKREFLHAAIINIIIHDM